MWHDSVLDLIGNTPLLRLAKLTDFPVFGKCEFLNPGGSIKDRIALRLIACAEAEGKLKPGDTIIEPTSGNTGIGMALVGVQKGYRVIICMPENMSEERKKIIRALGAELELTPAAASIQGAVDRAAELAAQPGYFMPQQFENPENPCCHYDTTAAEIWAQAEGQVGAFVAGIGSGGTLGGVGKYLKERNPDVQVIAVEPAGAAALLGQEPGLHQIQGIGDGFIPPVLDTSLIDHVVTVSDDDAIATARELARVEGLLVGTSSGANVWAAIRTARAFTDGNVVTILADRAERYFSTSLI
ncbi:MAG: cysteine synthase A [Armatimonadetes bacterium]|nr:cysteine synthase A [Armatimonadota bacterium]